VRSFAHGRQREAAPPPWLQRSYSRGESCGFESLGRLVAKRPPRPKAFPYGVMGEEHGTTAPARLCKCDEPSDVGKAGSGPRMLKSQPPDVGNTRSFDRERLKQPEADMEHCGIDLAVSSSSVCITDVRGRILVEQAVATEEEALREVFAGRPRTQCLVEASPLAEWVSNLLEGWGHTAKVIDTRKAKGVIRTKKKTDKLDARNLARMSRTGWFTVVHRKSREARAMRTYLQARQGLLQTALAQGSRIRGLLRAHGIKMGPVTRLGYASKVKELTLRKAPDLWPMLEPLVRVRDQAIRAAAQMKKQIIRQISQDPVGQRLLSAPGVGPLTAVAYKATIDQPERFASSRQVGSYVGLVPGVEQSGERDFHGHITREGDGLLRSYLFEAAHVLLTRRRGTCRIKKWGLKLAARKGYGKARVAVARKLAIILHRLWITGQAYQSV
jgi:transposase